MAGNAFADSVFAQAAPRVHGVGLRSMALAAGILAAVTLTLLIGLAWLAVHADQVPDGEQLAWLIGGVALFFAGWTVLMGWLLVRWLLRPLGDLAFAMRLIERGDYY